MPLSSSSVDRRILDHTRLLSDWVGYGGSKNTISSAFCPVLTQNSVLRRDLQTRRRRFGYCGRLSRGSAAHLFASEHPAEFAKTRDSRKLISPSHGLA